MIEFEPANRHANHMGNLRGGVPCDITDAALGVAYSSTFKECATFTTIEIEGQFLGPVWNPKLRAEVRMFRAGGTIGLVECNVIDEKDRLVARIEHMHDGSREARDGRALSPEINPKPSE